MVSLPSIADLMGPCPSRSTTPTDLQAPVVDISHLPDTLRPFRIMRRPASLNSVERDRSHTLSPGIAFSPSSSNFRSPHRVHNLYAGLHPPPGPVYLPSTSRDRLIRPEAYSSGGHLSHFEAGHGPQSISQYQGAAPPRSTTARPFTPEHGGPRTGGVAPVYVTDGDQSLQAPSQRSHIQTSSHSINSTSLAALRCVEATRLGKRRYDNHGEEDPEDVEVAAIYDDNLPEIRSMKDYNPGKIYAELIRDASGQPVSAKDGRSIWRWFNQEGEELDIKEIRVSEDVKDEWKRWMNTMKKDGTPGFSCKFQDVDNAKPKKCGKGYHTKHELKRHIQAHLKIKRWQCNGCGQAASQRSNAVHGHLPTHKKGTLYPCAHCDKHFKDIGQRDTHVEQAHTNGTPSSPSRKRPRRNV